MSRSSARTSPCSQMGFMLNELGRPHFKTL